MRGMVAVWLLLATSTAAAERPHVLFIAVDDLRPQLSCYGAWPMTTPNLDRLARTGRIFMRHYVQVPTCGASRFALWTGQYPRRPEALSNLAFRLLHEPASEPRPTTLPELFRQAGYRTESLGKVSHHPDGRLEGRIEMPEAWDDVWGPTGHWGDAEATYFGYADGSTRRRGESPAYESADVPDDGYADGLIAAEAVRRLQRLAQSPEQPFFLAVGFFKPHLPFNAPSGDWARYNPDAIRMAVHRRPPTGVDAAISLHPGNELLGQYTLGGQRCQRVDDVQARWLTHGYFAATTYVDRQVGRVLDELERLGLSERTIVVVWGDHGWHLGELGVWGKHTLHEHSLRSALIVRTPQMQRPGVGTYNIVQSVDLYPTLLELCRVSGPVPPEARSFARMLTELPLNRNEPACSFWHRGPHDGHTLRTDRWRLTEWRLRATGEVVQVELYDHHADPDETRNLATRRPHVVARLRPLLTTAP
jgi:arylsulfatase A-like enzyme